MCMSCLTLPKVAYSPDGGKHPVRNVCPPPTCRPQPLPAACTYRERRLSQMCRPAIRTLRTALFTDDMPLGIRKYPV